MDGRRGSGGSRFRFHSCATRLCICTNVTALSSFLLPFICCTRTAEPSSSCEKMCDKEQPEGFTAAMSTDRSALPGTTGQTSERGDIPQLSPVISRRSWDSRVIFQPHGCWSPAWNVSRPSDLLCSSFTLCLFSPASTQNDKSHIALSFSADGRAADPSPPGSVGSELTPFMRSRKKTSTI